MKKKLLQLLTIMFVFSLGNNLYGTPSECKFINEENLRLNESANDLVYEHKGVNSQFCEEQYYLFAYSHSRKPIQYNLSGSSKDQGKQTLGDNQGFGTSEDRIANNSINCITEGLDSDGDGVPDIVDIDDDNDGIPDVLECTSQQLYDIILGQALANPDGELVLPNGVIMTVKTAVTFATIVPADGHGTYDANPAILGGPLNGVDDLSDTNPGTATILPTFDGGDNPANFTRIAGVTAPLDGSNERITNPNDDFKRALGFYVEFSEPVEMGDFLMLDLDGREITREFATSFAFNGNDLVLPTVTVNSGGFKPAEVTTLTDATKGLNRYNNALVPNSAYSGTADREDITALDFARTNPTRTGTENNTDPDNLSSQANFEYNTIVTEVYFLWGSEGDGPNFEGVQNSGVSTFVLSLCNDSDGDGISDTVDLDSDNDGIPDAIEGCGLDASLLDTLCRIPFDENAVDENNCPTGATLYPCNNLLNTDTDTIPNYLDTDSDGDGCSDAMESGNGTIGTNDNISNTYDPNIIVDGNGLTNADGAPGCGHPSSNAWVEDQINTCNSTLPEDDVNTTLEDTPVNGNVLTNDSDPEGDTQMVGMIDTDGDGEPDAIPTPGTPINVGDGTLDIDPATGEYTFTPNVGFTGTVEIEYEVCDDGAPVICETATLVIDVIGEEGPNGEYPPIATHDNATTEPDTNVDIPILSNDSDPDGSIDPETVSLDATSIPGAICDSMDAQGDCLAVTVPGEGVYTVNPTTGVVTFDPDPTFSGETTPLSYEVCDDTTPIALCDEAMITVQISDPMVNEMTAEDDANSGQQGDTLDGNILDNDIDPDGSNGNPSITEVTVLDMNGMPVELTPGSTTPMTIYVEDPMNPDMYIAAGTLTVGTDGQYEFVGDPNFVGTVTIPYTACDNDGTMNACDDATLVLTTVQEITDLPVELLNFRASKQGENGLLNWSTSSELNNEYFMIERSMDGINFESIGRVEGAGTTNQKQDYTFTDNKTVRGFNYYRLNQYDFDGKSSYSQIKTIEFGNTESGVEAGFTIFPNPVYDKVIITYSKDIQDHKLMVYNNMGQVMSDGAYTSGMELDMTRYEPGVYMIQITDQEGNVLKSERLVKL